MPVGKYVGLTTIGSPTTRFGGEPAAAIDAWYDIVDDDARGRGKLFGGRLGWRRVSMRAYVRQQDTNFAAARAECASCVPP